ncbi:AcrR family transcriptional regulator [Leucobacter exalbidus]|uniref:AcrR family transcriptional regulator n=1 Tax=Leucobacter exalbidus TaxID=662960 RepID=A0A940PVC4_9MICO|nr:helix-turn-helix domain-containing protein [Leucobacter exalbidus]MBP1325974.1 AcrR family transcriptional regulator [Leucobacter exalbidus]
MVPPESRPDQATPLPQKTAGGASWSTPEVVEFLGISRQAINRRLQNRKLLGARALGVTMFPVWQFDAATHEVRPELALLLAEIDDGVDLGAVATWSTTSITGSGRTPGDLVVDPAMQSIALQLARDFEPTTGDEDAADAAQLEAQGADQFTDPADASGPQRAILQAAAELFVSRGPGKVTLREIAAKADVTYGLIHRFYGTKENLLVAVMQSLVSSGGDLLSGEHDIYKALDNSFGADLDAGQFGRMLGWAVFEDTPPERLLGGARSSGYRSQIDALWNDPVPPEVPEQFSSNTMAALIALIGAVWNIYEPYLNELAKRPGHPDPVPNQMRREVTDMLKVLIYATRPKE